MTGNRRSKAVPLWLLGSMVAVPGCSGPTVPVLSQQYVSKDDCLQDWGNESYCQPAPGVGTGGHGPTGGGGYAYFGPRYYWSRDENKPMVIDTDGEARPAAGTRINSAGSNVGANLHLGSTELGGFGSISRGGFGATGRGFSGGG
jgi:hypothetical protein